MAELPLTCTDATPGSRPSASSMASQAGAAAPGSGKESDAGPMSARVRAGARRPVDVGQHRTWTRDLGCKPLEVPMFHRILVTTDSSELSRKAVLAAIDLAAATKAALHVLHVVPRYPTSYFEGAVVLAPEEVSRIEKSWSDAAHALVEGVCKEARAAGVHAKAVVGHGDSVAEAVI